MSFLIKYRATHLYHRFIRQPMLRALGVKEVENWTEISINNLSMFLDSKLTSIEEKMDELYESIQLAQKIANEAAVRADEIANKMGVEKGVRLWK